MNTYSINRRNALKLTMLTAGSLSSGALSAFAAMPAAASASLSPQSTMEKMNEALAQLDGLVNDEMKGSGIPGVGIAVVYNDKTVYAKGFGVRQVGKPDAVDADTVFQLASVSKPIGATVIAALVEAEAVGWDSRISKIDPSFAMYDPWVTREVTVRDMYCHRSGLPQHAGDLLEDLGFSRDEVLHRLRYQRPDTSFRASYAYTNFGMTAAAVASAKAAGLTWEVASEQKLYRPLGMKSTSSRFADFIARDNRALGHVRQDGKWIQRYQRDPDAQTPAGGVSSSPNDLTKWMRLQIANGKFEGEQVIAEEPLVETHHPHMLTGFNPFTGLPGFYGLGWNVGYDPEGRLRLSHSGAFALGAGTTVVLVPQENLGIVILTNAYPLGIAEGLAATFIDLALYGKRTQDWLTIYKQRFSSPEVVGIAVGRDYSRPPASPTLALAARAYLGKYTNEFFGDIAIVEKDGGLAIVEGPQQRTFPMRHYDRDTFTYETHGENAVGTTGVVFTIGAGGKASNVVVENLNVSKEGVFIRVPEKK